MKDSREDVNLKQMRSVASKESAKTYEYYTPKKIVEMMARILDADTDEIYDPCCGSGAMLLTAASMLCQKDVSLYGQTKEKSSYTLCKMNAFLRDRQVRPIPTQITFGCKSSLNILQTTDAHVSSCRTVR